MDGVILCAGRGKRISSYIGGSQKCMIEFKGKPILEHIVEDFESVGVDNIYLVVGYKGKQVKEYFSRRYSSKNLIFVESKDFIEDSTSNCLSVVSDFVTGEFLYSQGEIVYDTNLVRGLYEFHLHEVSGVIGLSKKLEIAKTHPRVSVSE